MHNPPHLMVRAALVVALASAAPWVVAADSRAAARYYEDALVRYEKQDIAGAIVQLKNALKEDGKVLPAHVLLGKALLANGDVAAAEVAFNDALALGVNRAEVVLPLARAVIAQGRPRDVLEQPRLALQGLPAGTQSQLLLLRAGAAADLGDPKAALKSLEDARALDPTLAEAWAVEVPIRVRSGQFKEGLAAADKALAINPRLAEALYVRGTVLHVQGDLAGARAAYDRALAAEPSHVEALVSRAGLALDARRDADADRDVQQILRTSPRDPRGQYLRALVAERRGDAAAAKAALQEVTALLDPLPREFIRYRPQLLMLGGLAHYGLGQKEKALPYLEAVHRQQPNSPVAKLLAEVHLAQNNVDRGVEALESYLRGQPGDTQALQLLASVHMSQGRYVRATQLIQESLRTGTGDRPAAHALLGLSLVGAGNVGDATVELEAALAKDPRQVHAGTALATIYMQTGQGAKAQRVAEGLLKQRPDDPGVLNVVGLARHSAGDTAGARSAFEQAARRDPKFAAPQIHLARLDRGARASDKAAARMEALLRDDPNNVEAMVELGLALEQRGARADAQRSIEKAADLAGPKNLDPGLALVDFHLRAQQLEPAREAGKRLLSKAPEDPRVLVMQARISLAGGDAAGARPALTRAANARAYDAPALMRIALLQLQAEHLAGAAHTAGKVLAAEPAHLPALALMADIELRQGEPAKAEARARQIVARNPKLGVGHALLGDVAASRKDMAGAVEHYRRAHQADQTGASLLRLAGAVAATDPRAAQQLAEQWLRSHPDDAAVRRALGDHLARSGNHAAARAAYEAVLKTTPGDVEVMNNLAQVLILAKDPAGAWRVAQQALQADPQRPHVIGTAGWAAFKAGQPDRALQLLRDARLRDPANAETRYYLAAVLASAGRKAEAREELDAALRGNKRSFASAADAETLWKTLDAGASPTGR